MTATSGRSWCGQISAERLAASTRAGSESFLGSPTGGVPGWIELRGEPMVAGGQC